MLDFHILEVGHWLRLFRYRIFSYIFYAFGSVDFPKYVLVACIGLHYQSLYFVASGATSVKVIIVGL